MNRPLTRSKQSLKLVKASLVAASLIALPLLGNAAEAIAKNKAEAAKIAENKHGGKVLKVSSFKKKDKTFFKVKLVLDDGRVKTTEITGE